jgi:hypothetical protein
MQVTALLHSAWGRRVATVAELPSYDDQNFKVTTLEGDGFVVKISTPAQSTTGGGAAFCWGLCIDGVHSVCGFGDNTFLIDCFSY